MPWLTLKQEYFALPSLAGADPDATRCYRIPR